MTLERVIAALAPTEVVRRAPAEVQSLAHDATAVVSGALFFCLPGANADGHDFAAAALARGAVALVVERELDLPVPQLVVPDARAAMAVVADEFYDRPSGDLELVGVTGTSGKTTTAFLLHSILAAGGRGPALLGSVERRLGAETRLPTLNTPDALELQRLLREMVETGHKSCVMEASSHASAQHRLDRVRFAALVFTNLTQDHLDFHGTMDRYFEAKRRLFLVEPRPPAAVNVGDPFGRKLVAELRDGESSPVITFGLGRDAEVNPESFNVRSSLRGRFNVENVLGAIAAARLLAIDDEAIAAGIESLESVPGRFEPVDEGQPFSVLVDYAHKPDALRNVLQAARELGDGRLICVFGCGGDRDRGKRPLMGRIAAELSDLVIVTSDNPRSEDPDAIIDEIVAGIAGGGVETEPDRRLAIREALERADAGDVVVIAGKGHERYQEFGTGPVPFDDREVARAALRVLATRA